MEAEVCALAPPDWRVRTVEDVCDRITSGGTPSRKQPSYYINGKWPWVKTQELQDKWIDYTEEYITDQAILESSAKMLPENTVLLAMYGATVGQLGLLRKPMTCNQACCAMIVNEKQADYRYLFYQLLNARSQLKSLATGAAQQNLSGLLIKSLRFPFPTLPEQRAIAQILGTLDDKIESNLHMNDTLEQMTKSIFNSWFVKFDPVILKSEGKQPLGLSPEVAALFPDVLDDNENPLGWKTGTIQDCCRIIQNGGTPSRNEPLYWEDGDIPWLTSAEVRQKIVIQTEQHITKTGLLNSSAKMVPAGTTVVALYGATAGQVSFTAIPLTTNQAVCSLITDSDYRLFTYFFMRSQCESLLNKAVGSAQQNISKAIVENVGVLIPPRSVAKAFEELVAPQFERCVANLEQCRTLASLRDALLPKLISGQLRVKDVNDFIARTG